MFFGGIWIKKKIVVLLQNPRDRVSELILAFDKLLVRWLPPKKMLSVQCVSEMGLIASGDLCVTVTRNKAPP